MKRTRRIIISISTLVLIGIVALVLLTPYQYNQNYSCRAIQVTTRINVPASKVYAYLGNSANAANWSSFVDHITPLNSETVADGAKGSFRRCFVSADETGGKWDEEILLSEPNIRRRLSIFNIHDLPMQAPFLATEQLYSEQDGVTTLSFTLFFLQDPGFTDKAKMYLSAFRINSIFKNNLNNIKKILEDNESRIEKPL